jgi:hypothetical protein
MLRQLKHCTMQEDIHFSTGCDLSLSIGATRDKTKETEKA